LSWMTIFKSIHMAFFVNTSWACTLFRNNKQHVVLGQKRNCHRNMKNDWEKKEKTCSAYLSNKIFANSARVWTRSTSLKFVPTVQLIPYIYPAFVLFIFLCNLCMTFYM
jgi:hypothetical protein